MAQLELRSASQILGDIIRKILINTDLTAIVKGSDLTILLEAISEQISQTEVSALKILETINLESLIGSSLDKKAQSIRLPDGQGGYGRKASIQASGPVLIGSDFNKISTKLYAGKPAPFSGSTTLYVDNASDFPSSGSIYIGRGTIDRLEGPIPYSTAPVNNGSFWTITVNNPLTKNHLHSDLVVLSQGGDRIVQAGTKVLIPSNSESPAIKFTTTRGVTIPDGESQATVNVICDAFGEQGNALSGSIVAFESVPFPGANVTNPTTFQNGKSTESDEDLRQRIKDYPATLSRGVNSAILASIRGAVDPDTGRSIQSAVILNPVEPGDYARVFIDDGTGLEPRFSGQASESLLKSASGQETRFRLANYPVTSVIAEGSESSPFVLENGMSITVQVDDIIETYYINLDNYENISSATSYEVVRDLNTQSNIVGFRTLDNGSRIVMIDLSGNGEIIKVFQGDLQTILGFPTEEIRPLFLYKDSELLSFRGKTATLETRPRNDWDLDTNDLQDIRVKVDGVIQTFSITDEDFLPYQTNIDTATVSQYAEVFSKKIAGVKFTVSGQIIVWSTYQVFSRTGTLEILETREDGSPAGWVGENGIWSAANGTLYDEGKPKDYNFNRFSGEIELLYKPDAESSITVSSDNTRAHIISNKTTTGLFTLAKQNLTVGNSKIILSFDGSYAIRSTLIATGATITPSQPYPAEASNIIRLTANDVGVFFEAEYTDWLYLVSDLSTTIPIPSGLEGFYKISNKGDQKYPSDEVFSSLTAFGYVYNGVTASTLYESSKVTITFTNHGLKTGDLIRVDTSSAIGGISSANLSVYNVPIVVLDSSHFYFMSGGVATSSAIGALDEISFNIIEVEHLDHGFNDGSIIDISSLALVGGIDPSASSVAIEVIDTDSYKYRCLNAVLDNSIGTLSSLTYLSDCWIEFEVSSNQLVDWSAATGTAFDLSKNNINLFKSSTTPQLVEFGDFVSSLSVDDIVSVINSQIVSGTCEKINPQQLQIRSNRFDKTGTCAILATIGNGINVFSPSVSSGIQSHSGYSESLNIEIGCPVVSDMVKKNSLYPTRSYMVVDKVITDVLSEGSNPLIENKSTWASEYPEGFQHVWLTGRAEGYTGRVYNNEPTAPYSGVMTGSDVINPVNTWDYTQNIYNTLDRYSNIGLRFRDISINNYDNLTTILDLNPLDKTVSVPVYKYAKIEDIDDITGMGKGQIISFKLKDPEDSDKSFFDSSSVYKDFDFTDFKMLTRSVGIYREDLSDRALIIRSYEFGAPNKLRFSVRLASEPDLTDFLITHYNDFINDKARLNLIVTLPSGSIISGSSLTSGPYKITPILNGTIYDWRISAGSFNLNNEYIPGNVLNISGSVGISGSYIIDQSSSINLASVAATTLSGSSVVTVTAPSHNLSTGDLINITSTGSIGGISSFDLSVLSASVTVLNVNTFSYNALSSASFNDSGVIQSITSGFVIVKSPGNAGISTSQIFDAAQSPIISYEISDKTIDELRDAINAYLPENPVAICDSIGTDTDTVLITKPTYAIYPASTVYTGSDMQGAFGHHSFETHYSGSAGIYQYDSSSLLVNGIKATVQTNDSIFPTVAEATGTAYSPINEDVVIVPTNPKTVSKWLSFKASSSISLLADISRTKSDSSVQISSKTQGSGGAINITGVNANKLESYVIGNSTEIDDSIKVSILSTDAKSICRDQMVLIENNIKTSILRAYRKAPDDFNITTHNTEDINTYFRKTNSIKYIKTGVNSGRIIFMRYGMHSSQTEPLSIGNDITLTDLGSGLVQVSSSLGSAVDGGKLAARVGDMMYIQQVSPFPIDAKCKGLGVTGKTDPDEIEYIGYPVTQVIDDENIVIIAPNITSFGTTTLTSATDLVFMPAIWNEKNVRTNHKEGVKFDELVNNNKASFIIKRLGNGFMSVWMQNSANESTDDMLLSELSVNTDDYVIFGESFDPSNQGTFRIVAHNGRNHMVVYNPQCEDEVYDLESKYNGGSGFIKWHGGVLENGVLRDLRILSSDSVRIGDYLRISTSVENTQWFNNTFIGSWRIIGMGYQCIDYTGYALPHTTSSGVVDTSMICPYIDIEMTDSPLYISDTNGNPVDYFMLNDNDVSIGFTESEVFSCIRKVTGHCVNAQNTENSDVFLEPQLSSQKMSQTFLSKMTVLGKMGYDEDVNQGIDGYKYYSGLIRTAHRIIDGLSSNSVLYPGVKAAGAIVEVQTPLIKSIKVSLQVRTKDGVTLNSITDVIKGSVAGYINSIGVGSPVVISEIIRLVQSLPGVFSVEVTGTSPIATQDRIVCSEIEKPFVINSQSDITVG